MNKKIISLTIPQKKNGQKIDKAGSGGMCL
jgi:hypothetical protein